MPLAILQADHRRMIGTSGIDDEREQSRVEHINSVECLSATYLLVIRWRQRDEYSSTKADVARFDW